MIFSKKKNNDKIILCPNCEWKPDGRKYWACSCGHSWNTFKTKAKCPKCNTQWENTYCPRCRKSTPHDDWYRSKEELEELERLGNQDLIATKQRLESRLIAYGIGNYRISNLDYLNHTNENFHSTFEAGCRMMILFAISPNLKFRFGER